MRSFQTAVSGQAMKNEDARGMARKEDGDDHLGAIYVQESSQDLYEYGRQRANIMLARLVGVHNSWRAAPAEGQRGRLYIRHVGCRSTTRLFLFSKMFAFLCSQSTW